MNIAISYSRFSCALQREGDSLRRQLEAARRYCRDHGLELIETISDEGVSAFRGKNAISGSLGRFLKAIENGTIPQGATLIVESLDRLSREQVSEALELFLRIIRKGVAIVTLADGRRYDKAALNDFSQLVVSLAVMARAHEESLIKSQRVTAAYERKRELIIAKKSPPKNLATWLEWRDGKVRAVPSRVKVVRRIFQMCREGHGCAGIARIFNKEKVPPFRKGAWLQGTIRSILMRKTVCGYYQPKRHGVRGEFIPGVFPVVIDEQTWALVNQMRRRDLKRGQGKTSERNPFGRVLREFGTGFSLYLSNGARRKNGVRPQYYRPTDTQNGSCNRPTSSWERNKLVAAFKSVCAHAVQAPSSVISSEAQLACARDAVAEIQAKIDRVVNLVAEGDETTMATGRRKLAELGEQKKKAEAECERLVALAGMRPVDLSKINWDAPADVLRRRIAANVLRVEVDLMAKAFVVEFMDGRKFAYRQMLRKDGSICAFIAAVGQETPFVASSPLQLTPRKLRGSRPRTSKTA